MNNRCYGGLPSFCCNEGPVIETENLTKTYGKKTGIKDVSFKVERGEVLGFLGPNGAGKTTTINLLLDLIRPTSGHAKIFGLPVGKHGGKLRSCIGFIPGEMGFYENMKGLDYLKFFAGLRGINCTDRILELARFLFNVDLDRKVGTYSRGMKQLLGIIQAFMASPALYILDEPTANLDPLMTQRFYQLIYDEQKAGKTIFLSSHMLGEVERICKRVCIIKDGGIVAVDSVENIRRKMKRYVEFISDEEINPETLKVEGVSKVTRENNLFKLEIDGPLNAVLERLSHIEMESFDYRKMSLEEIFWDHFTKKEPSSVRGG